MPRRDGAKSAARSGRRESGRERPRVSCLGRLLRLLLLLLGGGGDDGGSGEGKVAIGSVCDEYGRFGQAYDQRQQCCVK